MSLNILCVDSDSSYFLIPGLTLWTKEQDAFNFSGHSPVIAHPPCPQWSRLRHFANYNLKEKVLAEWCWDIVNANGGIFEHPAGSSFFRYVGADMKKVFSVDQCWWGFPARKRTYLYFHRCSHIPFPLFNLPTVKQLNEIPPHLRSRSPLAFNQWLVDCVKETWK